MCSKKFSYWVLSGMVDVVQKATLCGLPITNIVSHTIATTDV